MERAVLAAASTGGGLESGTASAILQVLSAVLSEAVKDGDVEATTSVAELQEQLLDQTASGLSAGNAPVVTTSERIATSGVGTRAPARSTDVVRCRERRETT